MFMGHYPGEGRGSLYCVFKRPMPEAPSDWVQPGESMDDYMRRHKMLKE
jgi:hypothetical protein